MSTGHADLDILSVRWGRVGQPGQTLAAFLDAERGLHQASLLSEEHVYAEDGRAGGFAGQRRATLPKHHACSGYVGP